jgi:ribosomal protein S18 acetylase RimI-like enzyme
MAVIELRRLTAANADDLNRCDNSFTVEGMLRIHDLRLEETRPFRYTLEPVPPYVKRYDPEVYDATEYIDRSDRAAWIAYADEQVAGQLLVQENWNRFAIIWDIAVHPPFRRRGIGRRLMQEAIGWGRERGLPGVMLETQNINVAGCRLYESCGFVLGGVDSYLYKGTLPGSDEIALFWYLLFEYKRMP